MPPELEEKGVKAWVGSVEYCYDEWQEDETYDD